MSNKWRAAGLASGIEREESVLAWLSDETKWIPLPHLHRVEVSSYKKALQEVQRRTASTMDLAAKFVMKASTAKDLEPYCYVLKGLSEGILHITHEEHLAQSTPDLWLIPEIDLCGGRALCDLCKMGLSSLQLVCEECGRMYCPLCSFKTTVTKANEKEIAPSFCHRCKRKLCLIGRYAINEMRKLQQVLLEASRYLSGIPRAPSRNIHQSRHAYLQPKIIDIDDVTHNDVSDTLARGYPLVVENIPLDNNPWEPERLRSLLGIDEEALVWRSDRIGRM